jgi:predicted transcriptional regulator
MSNLDDTAEDFLELSSRQRLQILSKLLENKGKISQMAKELDATNQEIHRNFMRLEDGGFVVKNKDGNYILTTFGRTICFQIPSIIFLSQNKKYFEHHNFEDLPPKFVFRVGQLQKGEHIKGITTVFETWKSIYKNAEKYIYKIAPEVPLDLIEPLVNRIKKGITYNGILSENPIVPKGRKKLLKKLNFDELIEKGLAERRMKKNVKTIVILNEKEAVVSFPKLDGEDDLTQSFYGDDEMFHEWCLDYFRYCWYDSGMFKESKLKE